MILPGSYLEVDGGQIELGMRIACLSLLGLCFACF